MRGLNEVIGEMQSLNVDPLRIDEEIKKLESELSDYFSQEVNWNEPEDT
jgi:Txe/YoeB family toxin of Txe-Axe toxin-antitoxin module